jgi:hypothetical protein
MGTATTRRSFYELRAEGRGLPVHCLMELEHPVAADPWLCWLEASVQAHKALRRMPTPEELRPVTPQAARGLAKTVGLPRRLSG